MAKDIAAELFVSCLFLLIAVMCSKNHDHVHRKWLATANTASTAYCVPSRDYVMMRRLRAKLTPSCSCLLRPVVSTYATKTARQQDK